MSANRRVFVQGALIGFWAALGAFGAGVRSKVRRYHARPKQLCGLPEHDYQSTTPAPPVLAVSLDRVPLGTPGTNLLALQQPDMSAVYFQLGQASLQNEQCVISRVALTIGSSGDWILSLRADQNPPVPGSPAPLVAASPAPPRIILPGDTVDSRFTAYIKRNQFIVRVRGYGAFNAPADPDTTPGRPLLFDLAPPPFWVERGVPKFPRFESSDPRIAQYFNVIDRVEIEFSYR